MEEELILETYKEVLEGHGKFPKEYFESEFGFQRFCICIKYLIENYKSFANLEEMYNFFDSDVGKRFLYKCKLKIPTDLFSDVMLDVVKYITQDEPDSELIYNYILFERAFRIGDKEEHHQHSENKYSKQYCQKIQDEYNLEIFESKIREQERRQEWYLKRKKEKERKKKRREYQKQYRLKNGEKIREDNKKYYLNNKETIKEKSRNYYSKNKDEINGKVKQYQSENKGKISERKKQYYSENKEQIKEKSRQYRAQNKEKAREYNKKYRDENKEKIREYQREYRRKKKEEKMMIQQ